MSKDSFVKSVESSLINHFSLEQVSLISRIITKALSDYDMSERCTDLVTYDDTNDKLIRRYRACLMVEGKSERTIYQYVGALRRFSDDMNNKPFPEVDTFDIRYYFAMQIERGVSDRTRENTRAYLSAFFQWLLNEEIIAINPVAKVKPIKYAEEIRKPFSDIEIDAIRFACKSKKERALIEVLLSTGVRVSELSSMQTTDIDMNTMTVHVVHGKGAKERTTYITPVALKHLNAYLNNRKETGTALFYNRYHEPLNAGGIRKLLNAIEKRSEVEDIHPHRFRRTFATNLSKRGMEIQEIQKLLGHSNINTTMVYVSIDQNKVAASYRRFTA